MKIDIISIYKIIDYIDEMKVLQFDKFVKVPINTVNKDIVRDKDLLFHKVATIFNDDFDKYVVDKSSEIKQLSLHLYDSSSNVLHSTKDGRIKQNNFFKSFCNLSKDEIQKKFNSLEENILLENENYKDVFSNIYFSLQNDVKTNILLDDVSDTYAEMHLKEIANSLGIKFYSKQKNIVETIFDEYSGKKCSVIKDKMIVFLTGEELKNIENNQELFTIYENILVGRELELVDDDVSFKLLTKNITVVINDHSDYVPKLYNFITYVKDISSITKDSYIKLVNKLVEKNSNSLIFNSSELYFSNFEFLENFKISLAEIFLEYGYCFENILLMINILNDDILNIVKDNFGYDYYTKVIIEDVRYNGRGFTLSCSIREESLINDSSKRLGRL